MSTAEKWTLSIETPFGNEVCDFFISDLGEKGVQSTIKNEKGFIDFGPAKIIDGKFIWSTFVETPVKTSISLSAEVNQENIFGEILFDFNAKLNFFGIRS